jgi:hypothetical protein
MAMTVAEKEKWDKVYKHKFAEGTTPEHWPVEVKGISLNGLSLIGMNPRTNDLYWDGNKIEIVKVGLNWYDRACLGAGTGSAIILAIMELIKYFDH